MADEEERLKAEKLAAAKKRVILPSDSPLLSENAVKYSFSNMPVF
jgi:hypothetical protein